VTDAGLEHLKGLNLDDLLLFGTQVTEEGVDKFVREAEPGGVSWGR